MIPALQIERRGPGPSGATWQSNDGWAKGHAIGVMTNATVKELSDAVATIRAALPAMHGDPRGFEHRDPFGSYPYASWTGPGNAQNIAYVTLVNAGDALPKIFVEFHTTRQGVGDSQAVNQAVTIVQRIGKHVALQHARERQAPRPSTDPPALG